MHLWWFLKILRNRLASNCGVVSLYGIEGKFFECSEGLFTLNDENELQEGESPGWCIAVEDWFCDVNNPDSDYDFVVTYESWESLAGRAELKITFNSLGFGAKNFHEIKFRFKDTPTVPQITAHIRGTDPYGNFLLQGYELGPARDWARLGNLYLQDGVWMGERILPEGFVKFVSTVAPAWEADGRPIYGGFFWINGSKQYPIPKEAYYMAGAGGQTTIIIPSHDLVVVRLGHYKGARVGGKALRNALTLLMETVPESNWLFLGPLKN